VVIGWNVYVGTCEEDLEFSQFIPNEPVLAEAAAKLADEAEQHAAREVPGG
jgi:hypothetical protein